MTMKIIVVLVVAATTFSGCYSQDCLYGFSAVRNSSLGEGATVLPFTHTVLNDGNVFSLATNTFTAPVSGLYWLHWSVGMTKGVAVNVSLINTSRHPNVVVSSGILDNGGPSTTSRNEITQLAVGASVHLDSIGGLYSDEGLQTSFSGFPLQCVSNGEVVAFMVGRSTPVPFVSSDQGVEFDMVFFDTHNGWDEIYRRNYFTPVTGIWVISVLAASYPLEPYAIEVKINEIHLMAMIYHDQVYRDHGVDAASKTAITYIEERSSVTVNAPYTGAYIYSSPESYNIAFMGFLYNPSAHSPVAWQVECDQGQQYFGPIDPLVFPSVVLNEGNVYEAGVVTIPQAGVYYLHIATYLNWYYIQGKMELIVNDVPVANNYHESYGEDVLNYHYITLGRAIMLKLAVGDVVHVRIPAGWRINDDPRWETSFSGFLVYTV